MKIEETKELVIKDTIREISDRYTLDRFYGRYSVVYKNNKNPREYRLITSTGVFINGERYNKLTYLEKNIFIYEVVLSGEYFRGIINNGTETYEAKIHSELIYLQNNLFLEILHDENKKTIGYTIVDINGNIIYRGKNIDKDNILIEKDKIIYRTMSNNLIIGDTNGNILSIQKFKFPFKIILFNIDYCIIKNIKKPSSKNNNESDYYQYNFKDNSLNKIQYKQITSIYSNTKNKYYIAEDHESNSYIINNNLNILTRNLIKKSRIKKVLWDKFYIEEVTDYQKAESYERIQSFDSKFKVSGYKIYDDGIYYHNSGYWYDLKTNKHTYTSLSPYTKVIEAKNNLLITKCHAKTSSVPKENKYGIYVVDKGYYTGEIFDSVYVVDDFIIVNNHYIVPKDKVEDIKLQYILTVIDNQEHKYAFTFDTELAKNTLEKVLQEELSKYQKEYNENIFALNKQLNKEQDNAIRRLVLRHKKSKKR